MNFVGNLWWRKLGVETRLSSKVGDIMEALIRGASKFKSTSLINLQKSSGFIVTKGPVDGRDGWLGGGTGGGHHGCFQVHRLSISSVEINSSRYLQQNL